MAKVEFLPGIKCKNCGNIEVPPFRYHLCQGCGTKVVDGYNNKDGWLINGNADRISVKVTHKLFKTIYEEVVL